MKNPMLMVRTIPMRVVFFMLAEDVVGRVMTRPGPCVKSMTRVGDLY